jgi:hypothetical protein
MYSLLGRAAIAVAIVGSHYDIERACVSRQGARDEAITSPRDNSLAAVAARANGMPCPPGTVGPALIVSLAMRSGTFPGVNSHR